MNAINDNCEKALAFSLKHESGELLTTGEQTFLDEHINSCPVCRQEQEYLSKLSTGLSHADSLPGFESDELSRYRFINDIVKQADTEQQTYIINNHKSRRYLYIAAAGIAAALLFTVFAGLTYKTHKTPAGTDKTPPVHRQIELHASVLLHSDLDPELLEKTSSLKTGSTIDSQNGQLAVKLTPRISFLMDKQSKAVLSQVTDSKIVITLLKGSIISTVEPNIKGRDY